MHAWFDELDLDPTSSWRRMGTRALGDRPWLVRDDNAAGELALREQLLAERRDDVVATHGDGWRRPAEEVRSLVAAAGFAPDPGVDDPLEAAARVVQEDLCLLRRRHDRWHLDAAVVCFPSRWRLADKIGRPLVEVHEPVDGYRADLDRRVETFFDRLGSRPVLRRNWFVHPDGALHQPDAPAVDPIVPSESAMAELHLRSERQTLRALPSGWVLFTIRIQHAPLGEVLVGDRRHRFAAYVEEATPDDLAHRGMAADQVIELRAALRST